MLYLFNKDEVLVGQLKNDDILSCIQTEVLNGIIDIEFVIPQEALHKMENIEIVAHKDINNDDTFYIYKLTNNKNTADGVVFEGVYSAFDDLKGYGYIKDRRFGGTQAGVALDASLQGSRWSVGTIEPTSTGTTNFYYESRLSAISKILDTWDVELAYRINIAGSKITGRFVDLYNKRGRITHKRFAYGDNALEIIQEITQADLYTAVVGRGKGLPIEDDEGELTGGYSRKINFADVEWKISNGDPVDKPLGQEYVEIPARTALYGYSDGSPRFKVVDYNDIEDPEELLKRSYRDLEINSRPLADFKLTATNVEGLEIGDTVNVIRKDLNIYYTTRVFKVKRDILGRAVMELEFGDNINYSQSQKNKELKNEINSTNNTLNQIVRETNDNLNNFIKDIQDEIALTYLNNDGYNYELKIGNEWNLPAGYYSFNKPIDNDPTKVIYIGAGTMLISNSKDINGNWIWTTAASGDGMVANVINAGTFNANLIKAGILAPINGGSYINMNTGAFNFNNDIYYNPQDSKTTIRSSLITLDGNTNVTGNFKVSGNVVVGGTISASNFTSRDFTSNSTGDTTINGNSVSFGSNSSYLTIKDTGGRGQVDVNGTIRAMGSGYNYEINAGGFKLDRAESCALRYNGGAEMLYYGGASVRLSGNDIYLSGKRVIFDSGGTLKWV